MTANRCRTMAFVLVTAFLVALGWSPPGVFDAAAMEPGKIEPPPPVAAGDTPAPTDQPAAPDQPAAAKVASSNPMSGKPEAIEAGKKLYYTWCTQCHGPKANGESRFGSYAADLRKFWRGYKEFVVIVQNGRTARQMPPWKEVLNEAQIAQVGAFLETLAIEDANWR